MKEYNVSFQKEIKPEGEFFKHLRGPKRIGYFTEVIKADTFGEARWKVRQLHKGAKNIVIVENTEPSIDEVNQHE